jgi:glyoxylase-like metal-dependent hydrolase (beta-lactamase superfamily II)
MRCLTVFRKAGRADRYRIRPVPAHRLLAERDVIDLGEVVHTPGHSPGGIGLIEQTTGVFLSGDIVYNGPLIHDAYHPIPTSMP